MIDIRAIIGAAAVLFVAAAPAAWAQQGFNGSVIDNVYRNAASGCGYGAGYSGPGCPYGGYVCSSPGSCYYRAGPATASLATKPAREKRDSYHPRRSTKGSPCVRA